MLSEKLLAKLQQLFPDRGMRTGPSPQPCAVFPAIHLDVGDIQIYDDGDELTVVAGNFTHGHFTNYDTNLCIDEKEREIVHEVACFLEDLFADRVVLWGSHKGGGGWYYPEHAGPKGRYENEYLWSGPRQA